MVQVVGPEWFVGRDVVAEEVFPVVRLEVVAAEIGSGLTHKRPVEGEVDSEAVPDMRDVFAAGFRPEVVGDVLVVVERY